MSTTNQNKKARVAISNSRIVSFDETTVTFSYRKQGSRRSRKTTLDVFEFIRRFLQHVLPSGFMKVRHYGFMSRNCRVALNRLRLLILASVQPAHCNLSTLVPEKEPIVQPKPTCKDCGGLLRILYRIIPALPGRSPT
ncbi:MAG: hypothetical protein C4531_02180 [Desulfurivibrio sp.]|nr:MAG: hypothetical protein C4531_02180 [Desulfurivibrio sp.]